MLRYFLFIFLVAECSGAFQRRAPLVVARAGTFRGKVQISRQGRLYNSYRGIPFAKPPIGELRFAKPRPLRRIQGIFEASDFGPICIQETGQPDRGQEDCLTLNVFTPVRARTPRIIQPRRRLKKVLVFIHGGGLILDGSRSYVPGQLVARGDIVVVTVNYRLGFLGFLRGNTDELPGNQGIRDVLLALKWIQRNIRAFGGDPDDVTISGQSAGSAIATVLAISPESTGLFNKAIFISGGSSDLPNSPKASNDLLAMADTMFGCNVGSVDTPGDVNDVLQCLRNLPALDFDASAAVSSLFISSGDDILPRPILDLLADPQYLKGLNYFSRNYLFTVTKEDGYVNTNSDFIRVEDFSNPAQTNAFYAELFGAPVSFIENLFRPYRDLYPGDDETALTAYFTTTFIDRNTAYLIPYSNPPRGVSSGQAFQMSFDYMPGYIRNGYAIHTIDLVYLFDLKPQAALDFYYSTLRVQGPFTARDKRLEKSLVDLISDFVKTGNPGSTLSERFNIAWTPWNQEDKHYLSFNSRPEVKQDLRGMFP